jgi:pyrroline-5-carboxylate reductase
MRIGVIGTGVIASAVVRALAPQGHQITLSERNAERAAELARDFANVTPAPNAAVLEQSDLVFLGLQAGAAPKVLAPLRFRPDQRVISLMAGPDLAAVAALVAPARAEAVMLPYPAIATGGAPILLLGAPDLVTDLFGPQNPVFVLRDGAELADWLCAQAVLSPVAQLVEAAGAWLAPRAADPGAAEGFLRVLVASSLAAGPAGALLVALNTEGGYNQRLRQHMEGAGMAEALREGLNRLAGPPPEG